MRTVPIDSKKPQLLGELRLNNKLKNINNIADLQNESLKTVLAESFFELSTEK